MTEKEVSRRGAEARRERGERDECRPRLLALLAAVFLVCGGAAAQDEWTGLGPEGGIASALAIHPQDPSIVFAGGGNGVFRSSDGGMNWEKSSQGLQDVRVEDLAIDPDDPSRIYAGTQGGVFRSLDGGLSWQSAGQGLSEPFVEALLLVPGESGFLLAATQNGIFKSSDGGDQWEDSSQGLTLDRWVLNLIPSPQGEGIYAVTLLLGVYKSDDGGAQWKRISSGTSGVFTGALAIDPEGRIYAGTDQGVQRSEDGANWETFQAFRSFRFLAFDPANPTTPIGGTNRGIWFGLEEGTRWVSRSFVFPVSNLRSLAFSASDPLIRYVSGDSGTFRSMSGSQGWELAQKGLRLEAARSLAADPVNPFIFYAGTEQGEFRSNDGGQSWQRIPSTTDASTVRKILVHPASPNRITSARGASIYNSTDGGESWSPSFSTGSIFRTLLRDPSNPDVVYLGSGNNIGLWRSRDGGNDFDRIPTPLSSVRAVAVDPQNPMNLYIGGLDGLFKSTDGAEWAPAMQGISDIDIHSLAVDPSHPQVLYAGNSQGVYKSTDGGESWTLLAGPSTLVRSLLIDPLDTSRLWAGSWGEGVMASQDGGESWESFNEGLENPFVWELNLSGGLQRLLFASTLGGAAARKVDAPLAPAPFLTARMEVSGNAFPGGLLIYTITISNTGDFQPAASLVASFGTFLDLVEVQAEAGTVALGPSSGTLRWEGGIGAGQTIEIRVLATVLAGAANRRLTARSRLLIDNEGDGTFETALDVGDPALSGGLTIVDIGESPLETDLLAVPYALGIDSTFVGLAMANFSSFENGLEYLALDSQGQVQDQRIDEAVLGFQGQRPILTTEVFGQPSDSLAARGTAGALQGFFMMGDLDSNRLDGIGTALEDSQLLYITEVRSSGQTSTRLYFFNTDDASESEVDLLLFGPQGDPLSQTQFVLAPFGSLLSTADELFGPMEIADGYIRLEATRPVRGFALLADPDRFASMPARSSVLASGLLTPHFFWNEQGGTSLLRLLNPGSAAVAATVLLQGRQGEVLAEESLDLAPGRLEVVDVRDLLDVDLMPSGEGSLIVGLESDSLGPFEVPSRILGSITYDGGALGTLTSLPLLDKPADDTVFLQVAHSQEEGIFQGLALLNLGQSTFVQILAFDRQGDFTASKQLFLSANQRLAGLLDDPAFFGAGFQQIGGHLIVSQFPLGGSVTSISLFGGPRFLSALQGRPLQ